MSDTQTRSETLRRIQAARPVWTALAFLASCIKSGDAWTPLCDRMYAEAMAAMEVLTDPPESGRALPGGGEPAP